MASGKKTRSGLRSALLQANPVPMFLYDWRSLRILAVNDAALARYGYTAAEMHSLTIRDLRPHNSGPALYSCVHWNEETPSHSVWTHITRQGEQFAVELSVSFVHGRRQLGLLCALDATTWNPHMLRLARSQEICRSLVERCPFGIYSYDLTLRRYRQANPALLNLLDYSLEEFLALDRTILADTDERDRHMAELHDTGSIHEIETRLLGRDGRVVRASISGYISCNPENGHPCVHVYVRDITRQRELEEQLGNLRHMEAVGRFAGGVAHEFNNIVQSISLASELTLGASLPLPVRGKLITILQQANRAAEITQRLLAFTRRQLLRPRPVDLNRCIRQSSPALSRCIGPNVSLELQLGEALPPAFVDPDQLTVVLMHLADNARMALPGGGILRISTAIAPEAVDSTLCLTVSDNGEGMDEPTRQRIFEPFFSTKKSTAETAGLGLSTVHGFVHQSNGRIECESAPGCGATFRIFLPTALPNPNAAAPVD